MKRSLICILIILGITSLNVPTANSAGYANCVSVSNAEVIKDFGSLVYKLKIQDLCNAGIRSYSFILHSNKFLVSDVQKLFVILNTYENYVTFSLKDYKPGDYFPTLEISSSQDRERRTISLPGFRVDSPIDCLEVTNSGLDLSKQSYSLKVKNICSSLDSYSFGNVYFELQGNGLSGIYSQSQKLYSISEFGTSLNFRLTGIISGTYFPELYVRDYTNSGSKVIQLTGFTIEKEATQSSSPVSTKQVCVSGKNYSQKCFDFPDWTFEICSANPAGKVQIQSGPAWLFGWNFKGVKDLERCQSVYPFLITINGTTESSANLRLSFAKYQSKLAFYSNFKLAVR